ncbi:CdaR family protein, partial [Candidatus Oleimmundimicrobium sp.]|uniref:CdaR family protein n=1 Tax=Candidatus Oleimmundimicrobium sp. TaxID=3060597 RepID=UPI0027283EB8
AGGENPMVENFIDISLTPNNLSGGLVIKEFPANVSVGIRGPKNVINNISPNQISGKVNFSEISKEGLYKLKVEVTTPKGTQITRIIPPEIKVEVEGILAKEVEVVYSLIGIPEKGFSLADEPQFNPSKVKIIGAQSVLESIKQIICAIDISGIKEDLNKRIKVKAVDINGNDIKEVKIDPDIVEVSISMTRGYPEKRLAVKPKIIGKPAPGYYISEILSSPDEIKIFGNYFKINNIEFLETIPIDVSGITKTLSVKVPPALEEGLSIVEGEVGLIEVAIQVKEAIIQKILKNISVVPQNLSPFVSCEIIPEVVDITVEGKNILVDKLQAEDVKAYVKFTDDFRKEQKVKVQVDLTEGISLIKIEPEEVTMLINK